MHPTCTDSIDYKVLLLLLLSHFHRLCGLKLCTFTFISFTFLLFNGKFHLFIVTSDGLFPSKLWKETIFFVNRENMFSSSPTFLTCCDIYSISAGFLFPRYLICSYLRQIFHTNHTNIYRELLFQVYYVQYSSQFLDRCLNSSGFVCTQRRMIRASVVLCVFELTKLWNNVNETLENLRRNMFYW